MSAGGNHLTDQSDYAIADASSLRDAAACLHDARIPNSGFNFDRASRTFYLEAWQYSAFSYTGPSGVWTRWDLTFRDVTGSKKRRTEPSAQHHFYELFTIRWYPQRQMIVIATHFDLTLYLKVTTLNGNLRPTDDYAEDIETILN